MTTLTVSAAPITASATSDSAIDLDSAKTTVAIPKTITAWNIRMPTRRLIEVRASSTVIASAPIAGAPRSAPSPHGPVCSTSRAKIGISAVAPPSSTAKRSSEIVPRIGRFARTKRTPAKSSTSRAVGPSARRAGRRGSAR